MTFSIKAECCHAECRCAECPYAECPYADVLMLNVSNNPFMLSVVILSVDMLRVISPHKLSNYCIIKRKKLNKNM